MSKNHATFVKREGAEKHLAFRVSEWFDADAWVPKYGVQAQVKKGLWCHLSQDGAPLIFPDKVDAYVEVARLRTLKGSSASTPPNPVREAAE